MVYRLNHKNWILCFHCYFYRIKSIVYSYSLSFSLTSLVLQRYNKNFFLLLVRFLCNVSFSSTILQDVCVCVFERTQKFFD